MYQFFVEPGAIHENDKCVYITGADVNHIKNVLRMRVGEELSVSNGCDGKEYRCAVAAFEKTASGEDCVRCQLRFIKEASNELPCKIYLFQGLPKSDKMELILQKAVELGVYQVIPVAMKRCVVKLDEKKAKSKVARWQAIAEAAAKQSKRGIIPTVQEVMPFKQALAYATSLDVKLVPYELAEGMPKTKAILENIKPGQSVAIFIGPEGGFDEAEILAAKEQGMEVITLGKRILRTETAGMTVLAWLGYLLEQ